MDKCTQCQQNQKTYSPFNCFHKICKKCLEKYILHDDKGPKLCIRVGCSAEINESVLKKVFGDDEYAKLKNKLNPRWPCLSCTALNLPLIKFCFVCQTNRPDSYTPPKWYEATKEEIDAKNLEEEEMKKEKEQLAKEEERKKEGLEVLKMLSKEEVTMTREISECPVCMLEYEPGEAIVLHSCLHTVCKECFKNYLINVDQPKIKCPTENCIGQIEDREIKKMLTDEDYDKYNQLSMRTAEATETLSFHCKGVNCSAWIVHDEWVRSFRCPLCQKENCIKCKVIHEGETCENYQKSTENKSLNDAYFQNMLRDGQAMICSGCKVLVEKVKGCDWVKCKLCKTELCWATKGPRWGPKGPRDTSGGCRCMVDGKKCHPSCMYCH